MGAYEFLRARQMSRDPAYARREQQAEEQRRIEQNTQSMASPESLLSVFGAPEQVTPPTEQQINTAVLPSYEKSLLGAKMGVNPTTTEGSGLLGMDLPPEQLAYIQQQKNMMGTGNAGYQKQSLANLGAMQGQGMAGVNQRALATHNNKINPKKRKVGYDDFVGMSPHERIQFELFNQARSTAKPNITNTNIDVGSGVKSGYLTDEEKIAGGFDVDSPMVWNKSQVPQHIKTTGFTEGQVKAGGYADRMEKAGSGFNSLVNEGYDPSSIQQAIGEASPILGNVMMSPEQQQGRQFADDWIRAKLREESGAVIADDEMEKEYEIYFPILGDSTAVISQKEKARKLATKNMAKQGGRTKKEIKGAEDYSKLSDSQLQEKLKSLQK